MKLLLFSDVHCSQPAIQRLLDLSSQVDILVGAGDFGTMRRGTAETLQPFQDLDKPLVLVCGNGESDQELREATPWEHAHVLHGTGVELLGQSFFGLGGGIPVTPFGSWSFDLNEEQAAVALNACPTDGILVVHSPPLGTVDVSRQGGHFGSQSIREAILRARPRLTVCGHIHDSAGRFEMLDGLPVVNAGPDGIIWDLDTCGPIGSST